MADRLARDDEVETWRRDGWVLLDGLLDVATIDDARPDLWEVFPTPDDYHADPEAVTREWLGTPGRSRVDFVWPADGPGFRPEQHRWRAEFPLPGSGKLNRLFVHPSIVDFVERVVGTDDLRCYQAQVGAKYAGTTNYEQPMHTDRNHSWLPPRGEAPWWHVESFLYLSDVDAQSAPTHLVRLPDSAGTPVTVPLLWPSRDPEVYAAERPAAGRRGSLLAYRPDVFHRAVDLDAEHGSRFLLNVSFKAAGQDWVGYHVQQSRSTSPDWTAFVEGSSPRELALFGFPPPGHPVWNEAMLDATAARYPHLDLTAWRTAAAVEPPTPD
jgi:hypothetical protein